ncbi:MAG: hypothetical protein K8S54_12440 [Spirochaetia bacterium]|nr:hypothetical protein [Spirochaetia bacterium]
MKKVDLALLEPLAVSWNRKPVNAAKTGCRYLPDGRVQFWIEHDLVRGVTPEMLVWWFSHLEGSLDYNGMIVNRYRIWHPEDHVHASYERRLPDGTVGPGAQIRLVEYFGRNPNYIVNVVTDIEKLDLSGFRHVPRLHGWLRIATMDYSFQNVTGGTRYVNSLTIGWKGWTWKLVRSLFLRFVFPEARGFAWIKHNVEEVGQFERFLPGLYASENRLAG